MIYKWGSSIAMFDFQRVVGHLGKSPQVVAATFCNHQPALTSRARSTEASCIHTIGREEPPLHVLFAKRQHLKSASHVLPVIKNRKAFFIIIDHPFPLSRKLSGWENS
jgi:hypothetical protein